LDEEGQKGWRQTLGVLWLAQVASFSGFSFVFPFLPFYIRELGVPDDRHVSLWVGIIVSSSAVTMALVAPLWGALADRYGRKIMVERSTFAAAVSLALMSLAQSPWHVLGIRILQGALSGTISAATTMVASVTPGHRVGFSLGLLQTASFIGSSLGPFVGGYAAEAIGYRKCFLLGAGLLFLAGVLVVLFAREEWPPAGLRADRGRARPGPSFWVILAAGGFAVLLVLQMTTQMAHQALGPIFPLYVRDLLGAAGASMDRAPSTTGVLLGIGGVSAALAAVAVGWWADRARPGRLLGIATLCVGASLGLHFWIRSLVPLAAIRFFLGASLGAIQPSLNILIHRLIPRDSHGKAYGLSQSATSIGFALGPSTGGALGAWRGFREPFLFLGILEFLLGLFLLWRLPKSLRGLGSAENGKCAAPGPVAPSAGGASIR
jgi:DHA1 family multidrug resistance protein-like MFS transporter